VRKRVLYARLATSQDLDALGEASGEAESAA
jgi:hypothetical protein